MNGLLFNQTKKYLETNLVKIPFFLSVKQEAQTMQARTACWFSRLSSARSRGPPKMAGNIFWRCKGPLFDSKLCAWLIYICRLFSGFSNVYHFTCVWPTALKLGCITNFDMLFLVMGLISLDENIQCMLTSSRHICIRSMFSRSQALGVVCVKKWIRHFQTALCTSFQKLFAKYNYSWRCIE